MFGGEDEPAVMRRRSVRATLWPVRRVIVGVMGVIALLPACAATHHPSPPGPVVPMSGTMPAVTGQTLTGGTLAPGDYRGKVVVLNFWNYDCPPCRQEQPALEAAWRRLAGKNVQFIGLMYVQTWPHDAAAARAYLHTFGVTYPTMIDTGGKISDKLPMYAIPTTFIIDPTGHLRYRISGVVRPGELDAPIGKMLAAARSASPA
jgi:peroxiredoxin